MAIDKVPVHVRFEFVFSGSEEIQDTGFWCMPYPAGSGSLIDWDEAPDRIAEKARDAWNDHVTKTYFGPRVVAQRVVVFSYENDLTARNASSRGESPFTGADAWAGAAQEQLPPQLTAALSMFAYGVGEYTSTRGRKRGRMFLPALGVSALATGTLGAAAQQTLADNFQAFFNDFSGTIDLADGSDFNMRPVVLSRAPLEATKPTAKNYFPVQRVAVGSVVDTMRSRRNQLVETYLNRDINTP